MKHPAGSLQMNNGEPRLPTFPASKEPQLRACSTALETNSLLSCLREGFKSLRRKILRCGNRRHCPTQSGHLELSRCFGHGETTWAKCNDRGTEVGSGCALYHCHLPKRTTLRLTWPGAAQPARINVSFQKFGKNTWFILCPNMQPVSLPVSMRFIRASNS